MKKAIITGANGFVGRYLVRELVQRGYELLCIVRNEQEDIRCLDGLNIQVIYCDLRDITELSKKICQRKFDCFYHLAWAGSSGNARMDYGLQLLNARQCADAAKAAWQLGCKRFVGAGSVTELMFGEYLKQDGSVPEMTACYAIGKIAAEYVTKCVCTEHRIDFLWGYISNFYGAEDTTQNFINYLIDEYLAGHIPVLTNGEQKADFMYVSDVARALVAMGEKGKNNCSYYIGYGEPKPLKEFVLKVRNTVNPSIAAGLGKKPFRGVDIDFGKLDIGKLRRDTGFVPIVNFTEGIKKTLEWRNLQ